MNPPLNASIEFDEIVVPKVRDWMSSNPNLGPDSDEYKAQWNGWKESALETIRDRSRQDVLSQLFDLGVEGLSKTPSGPDEGTYRFDTIDPSISEYADLFSDAYLANDEETLKKLKWSEWQKNKFTKTQAMVYGLVHDAMTTFEAMAGGISAWAFGGSKDVRNDLGEMMRLSPRERKERQGDDDYWATRQKFADADTEGARRMGVDAASLITESILFGISPALSVQRGMVRGDPHDPTDLRKTKGRAGGGFLVKASEMTGKAIGVIPWSIPAMATRKPAVAFALTTPFYAAAAQGAYDDRLAIYKAQVEDARAAGLPEPAAPSRANVLAYARASGLIELGSEYTIDRLQLGLLGGFKWASKSRVAGMSPQSVAAATEELAASYARRGGKGILGKVKSAARLGAAAVSEGIEEMVPALGQEVLDPLFIPKGYESDFWSWDTAEAFGIGSIAGGIMVGGYQTFGAAPRESRRQSSAIRKAIKEGKADWIGSALKGKATRLGIESLRANSGMAMTESMAMHQLDEMAAGRRVAIVISPADADRVVTPAVRQRMESMGVVSRAQFGQGNLYIQPARESDWQEAVAANDTDYLFGRPKMVEPNAAATGAFVVRNKKGQIIDVMPYTDSSVADQMSSSIVADAISADSTVDRVEGDDLADVAAQLAEQMEAQAVTSGAVPAGPRQPNAVQRRRGINSLSKEMGESARGTLDEEPAPLQGESEEQHAARRAAWADAPFQSNLLTDKELDGARNSDVEVETVLTEVPESALSDAEKLVSKTTGVSPTVLDGKAIFRIRRKDGSVQTIEKSFDNDGAYIAQDSPDGVFLIRDSTGNPFTRRNAFVVAMHELRHRMAAQSRASAEYLGHLFWLDPEFALRGGLQYMADVNPSMFASEQGRISEDEVLGSMAAQYGAAQAVLQDVEGYAQAQRVLRNPDASATEAKDARQRVEEQKQALAAVKQAEMLAEESVAQSQTEGLGQTAELAAEFEAVYKRRRDGSLRSFLAWMAHVLERNGYDGPMARQALYEIRQRMEGKTDAEMQVFSESRREAQRNYEKANRAWNERRSTQKSESRGGVGVPEQAERGLAGGASYSKRPKKQPSMPVALPAEEPADRAVEEADPKAALEQAQKELSSASDPEAKSNALAKTVQAIARYLPMLSEATAQMGVTTRPPSERVPSVPPSPRRPRQAAPTEQAAPQQGQETVQDESSPFYGMTTVDPRDRQAMMSLRPIKRSEMTPEMAAWSEGSQVVDENGDLIPVYHGTRSDFDAFGRMNTSYGYYFTPDEEAARYYAGSDGKVIPAVLNARNVADLRDATAFLQSAPKYFDAWIDEEFDGDRQDAQDWMESGDLYARGLGRTQRSMMRELEALGYDGVVFPDAKGGGGVADSYVVFNANQIKGYFNERPTQAPEIMGSRRTLRGEWWLTESGPLFADGDVGDMNHEMLAQQEAVRDIASDFRRIAAASADDALKSRLEQFYARIEEMDQGDGWDFNEAQDMVRDIVGDEGLTAFMESAGVPQEQREQFRRRANFAMGLGDPREYGFDKNWVRVQGNNIQMRGLNDSSLRSVADQLYEAEGEQVLDQVFTVEDMAARRTYDDVPFEALEKGIRGLAPYRGAQYSRRPQPPEGMQVATRFTVGAANMGLLNNQALNYDKLNDEEEMEVVELLNYGLQQPRGVPNTAKFYFTEEGLQKNARLIELLKKAARGPVRETKVFAPLNPLWASQDGQIAVQPKDVMAIPPDASSDIMGSRRPPLYSALKKELLAVDSDRLSPQAWSQRIAALVNKGTVKSDEVEWSGITDFLRLAGGNKVSKQEISDYLDENGIQIERVVGASERFARRRSIAEQLYEEFRANPPSIPYGNNPDSENPAERPLVGSYGERMMNAVTPNRFRAHDALDRALEMTGDVQFYDDVGGYSVWMTKTDEYGTGYTYALGGNANPTVFQTEEEAEDAIASEIANAVRVARRDVDQAGSGVAQLNDMLSTFLELQDPLLGTTRFSDAHMQFITDIAERSGNPRAIEIAKELVEANKPDEGAVYGEPQYEFVGLGGQNYRETILRLPKIKGKKFPRSYSDVSPETPDSDLGFESHNWAILNPVAHYRTDEALVRRANSSIERAMRVFEIQSDWAQGRRSGEEKLQAADPIRIPDDHPLKRRIEELKAQIAPLDEEARRLNRPAVNLAGSQYYLDTAFEWFKSRYDTSMPLDMAPNFLEGDLGRDGIERFFARVKETRPETGAISPDLDVSEADIDAIRDHVLARHAMQPTQELLKEAERDLELLEAGRMRRSGLTDEELSATERDAPFVTSQKFGVFKDGSEVLYTDEKGNQNPRRYQSMREAEIAAEKVGGEARDLGKRADTEGFVNLALRNIILDAIEMGHSSIAFATGAQVNAALRQDPESVAGKGNVKFYDDVFPKILQKFVKKINAGTLTKAMVASSLSTGGAGASKTNTVLDMSPEFIERAKGGIAMMSRRNQTGGAIGAAMRVAGGEPTRKFKTEDSFFLGPAAGFPSLLRRGRGQLRPDARNIREAARRSVQDVSAWLKNENKRFADYYENDWKATQGFLEAHYKRPLTREEMKVSRFLAGVTSPNTGLASNITDMVMLLDHWMSKGNFDAFEFGVNEWGAPKGVTGPYKISGTSAPNKLKVIKSIQKVAERLGSWDAALEYMMQTDTIKNLSEEKKSLGYKGGVGEVGKVRRVVEYASGTSDVVPRLFMFGPKVGAYTMNALGDSRYTTVDLWESRFIRAQFKGMFEKNTGLPVGEDEHDLFVRFGEMFNEEWKKATGDDMQPSALQAVRWFYIIDTAKRLGYSKASTNETISNYTARSIESRLQDRGTDQAGGRRRARKAQSGADVAAAQAVQDPAEVTTDAVTGQPVTDAMFSMRRGARGIKDEATTRFIDRFDELLRTQRVAEERLGALSDAANPYQGARTLQGRIGAMQQEAERRYADLLRRQHEAEIDHEEMDRFLYAQHASERNRYIARIDPTRPDGGSGMTNREARDEIAAVARSGRLPEFERFADEWRTMLREALDARLAAGLIRRDVYDAVNREYTRYVPLRGIAARDPWDADFDESAPVLARGLSTTGRGMPMATGRRSQAVGVSSQVAYVHEDTIRRIARNEIGQRFLRLMQMMNDRRWGEIVRPTRRVVVDGAVRVVHDPTWTQDGRHFGVFVNEATRINGHDYAAGDLVVIRVNNERLARALMEPTMDLRWWERGLRVANNVWRMMTTGPLNPAFAPVNLIRDLGTATINNTLQRGAIDTLGMLRRYPRAFIRVMADEWLGNRPTGSYADFVEAGGQQLYWRENDLDVKRTDFERLARRVQRRDPNDRGLAKTLLGWYPAFFTAAETSVRLAQFEQRVASGDTAERAALAARDLTVDFAKGGTVKPVLNTWYVFANAALQGNANILTSLIANPVRSALTVPHLILLGYAMSAMSRAMGGDDEERGQSRWDSIPDYEKTANMFFFDPSGSGKYVKVPMPYGWNVIVSAGVRLEHAVSGRASGADMIGGVLNDALNAFNPIGGSGITSGSAGLLTSMVPTMVRPLAEITANRDFAGRPIYKEQIGRLKVPESQTAFESTPEAYRKVAEFLNTTTGGDEFEGGAFDVSPDTMRYLAGYYASGTGRIMDRILTATTAPEGPELNDIPVLRSFVGDAANDRRSLSQQYYSIAESVVPTALRMRAIMEPESAEQEQAARGSIDMGKVPLAELVNAAEKELIRLRRIAKTATPEQRERIAEVRRKVQATVVRRANEIDQRE